MEFALYRLLVSSFYDIKFGFQLELLFKHLMLDD